MDAADRAGMLRVPSIGPRMVAYLEEIGIRRLEDLAGADAGEIALRINVALGRRHINATGIAALAALIRHVEHSQAQAGQGL